VPVHVPFRERYTAACAFGFNACVHGCCEAELGAGGSVALALAQNVARRRRAIMMRTGKETRDGTLVL
jgi:hypothetical protein